MRYIIHYKLQEPSDMSAPSNTSVNPRSNAPAFARHVSLNSNAPLAEVTVNVFHRREVAGIAQGDILQLSKGPMLLDGLGHEVFEA